MPNAETASECKHIIDADLGKLVELSRETRLYRNISYENRSFATGSKGAYIWNVEVTAQSAAVSDSTMNEILAISRQ